jgi:hypothetical protein
MKRIERRTARRETENANLQASVQIRAVLRSIRIQIVGASQGATTLNGYRLGGLHATFPAALGGRTATASEERR